jgi:hypothetical protein
MAPRLELYAFRYRDLLTGKWVRARYRAELHEIKQRYAEFEITEPLEIRDVNPDARYFAPHFNAMMARSCGGSESDHVSFSRRSTRSKRSWCDCFCADMSPTAPGVGGSLRCRARRGY